MARDVLVRFRVSDDGTVALERVARAADKAEDQLAQAGREGKEAGDKIHAGARHGESGIGGLLGKLGAIAAAMGGIYALKAGFEAIITTGAKFESLGRSFETAMGSAAAGEQAMAWVKQFTAETPYQLEQVAGGFLRLRNAGIDPTSGSLEALGDAVAAYAGGSEEAFGRVVTAVGQIGAKGKLTGEELMQLAEANIPVYQILQEKLGLTGEQVGNIGAQGISAAVGLQALFEGLNERVGGAMAAQMTTLGGLWSNFQDQVTATLNELATNGAMDAVKDGLGAISAKIKELGDNGTVQRIAEQFGQWLGAAAEKLPGVLDAMVSIARTIGDMVPVVVELGKVLAVLWAVEKVQAFYAVLVTLPAAFRAASVGAASFTVALGPIAVAAAAAFAAVQMLKGALDRMNLLDGYTDDLEKAAREQEAFNLALVSTYGSLSEASKLFGMSTDELFDYYKQIEAAGTANTKWNEIIDTTHTILAQLNRTTDDATTAVGGHAVAVRTLTEEQRRAIDRRVEQEASAAIKVANFWIDAYREQDAERRRLWDETERLFLSDPTLVLGMQADAKEMGDAIVEEVGGSLEGAFDAGAAHLEDVLEEMRTDWQTFTADVTSILSGGITEGIVTALSGDDIMDAVSGMFEGLGQLFSSTFQRELNQSLTSGDWSNFITRDSEGNVRLGSGAVSLGGMIGTSMVSYGQQHGNQTVGALGGAGSAAAAWGPLWSVPVYGWIGGVVATIVGGLVGYLSSGSETPTTGARIGVGGADIFDTGGHQGYTEERRTRWEQSMNAVYLRQWQQYRGIAEMFGQADLLGLMGELPSWTTDVAGTSSRESMEVSAEELARILSDTILPAEFAETFRSVFRTGLERIGISDAMFGELESMLAGLPGQERMRYLQDYVGTVVGMSRLLVDLGTETVATRGGPQQMSNLTARAGQDPWDTFWQGFDEALGQVDVLTAGWDEMNLAMQIEQGAQVLQLGQTWYENMLQYQTALIQMEDQMQAGIDSFRDRLTLRDMTDAEKGAWYQQEFQTALSSMRGATTPTGVQDAYNRAMQMLQGLEGLGGSGYEMPSWMLQGLLSQLEEQMQASMGGLQSEVETQAQALGAAIGDVLADLLGVGENAEGFQSVGGALADFSDAVEEITGGGKGDEGDLSQLGGKARETGDNLDRLGSAADRLAQALDAAAASAYSAASGTGGYSAALARLAYEITLAQTRGMSAATQSAAFA